MGRFSLGAADGGCFTRHAPASPPLAAAAGRREVSSGRRGVRASSKRNFCAAFKKKAYGSPGGSCAASEPVKKACKFGLGSSGVLQSKDDGDESQVGQLQRAIGHIVDDTRSGRRIAHAALSWNLALNFDEGMARTNTKCMVNRPGLSG